MESACSCHFCCPRRSPFDGLNPSRTCFVWMLIIILLLRGSLAASLGGNKATDGGNNQPSINKDSTLSYISSQRMLINSSQATDCGVENCSCYPTGKCKPCSRLDMGRKLPECLLTGYKQRAYCPFLKEEHVISCHYVSNPAETRRFWLFEGSAVSLGAIAFGLVYLRQRRIRKIVAHRIQQQINA